MNRVCPIDATMSKLEEAEISKFWEIFSGLDPVNGLLAGEKVAGVLKRSDLPDSELERVWDLSDIDSDGNLDFEEFCVAMKMIYDRVTGVTMSIPMELPTWLVPASKSHLIEANRAVSTNSLGLGPNLGRVNSNESSDDDPVLSSDFDWYISPSDRDNYNRIYTLNSDHYGLISFDSLTELYQTLSNVPDTDLRSAWNMVNPRSNEKIDKDQCIVFLHILSNRSRGVRLPRAVPASLRATFEKARPEYDLNSRQAQIRRGGSRDGESDELDMDRFRSNGSSSPSSSRKETFGEQYVSRLGLGSSRSTYSPSGTDFSASSGDDWNEVRLKRQLADLEKQLEQAEAAAERRRKGLEDYGSSRSGLIKRELEQLLDYKEKQLLAAQKGTSSKSTGDISASRDEVEMIASQVAELKSHVDQKERELETLRAQLLK